MTPLPEDHSTFEIATVERLWIWPVKSMQGIEVGSFEIGPRGVVGDRNWAVLDGRPHRRGRPVSARTRPQLLQWSPLLQREGPPRLQAPDGTTWGWTDPGLISVLSDALRMPVLLSRQGQFVDLDDSLLLTTQASHEAVENQIGSLDPRRWRGNVHISDSGLEPYSEIAWEGAQLTIGAVNTRVLHPCPRCAIPTWDPDGSLRNPSVLTTVLKRFDGKMGMNLRALGEGRVRVGDRVRLRRSVTPKTSQVSA